MSFFNLPTYDRYSGTFHRGNVFNGSIGIVTGGSLYPSTPPPTNPVTASPSSFAQTFYDPFTASGLDTTKWITHYVDTPGGANRYASGTEQQGYVDLPDANFVIAGDGYANFTATRESYTDPVGQAHAFKSCLINTNGQSSPKFSQLYGYFEANIQMPGAAMGRFPAFWLYTPYAGYSGRPHWEIDIVETYNTDTSFLQSLAWNSAGDLQTYTAYRASSDLTAGYHKYGCYWTPSFVAIYFDDALIWTMTDPTYIPTLAMVILVNFAVSSDVTGGAVYPQTMSIDYVRAYQNILPSGGGGGGSNPNLIFNTALNSQYLGVI